MGANRPITLCQEVNSITQGLCVGSGTQNTVYFLGFSRFWQSSLLSIFWQVQLRGIFVRQIIKKN